MKKKLALNFKETKDPDLYVLGFTVAEHMTGNEYFPDPGMLIIELQEISTQFRQAIVDAKSRDVEKVAYKNNVRVELIKKLKQVGEFVIAKSNGKELPLVSSGFTLYKPEDEVILGTPTNFRIKPGPNPGEIIMQVSRVKGARSYMYQWTPEPVTPKSVWESSIDTRCKKVIKGLPLGVNYAFRMAAIGSRSQIKFTRSLSRYIS